MYAISWLLAVQSIILLVESTYTRWDILRNVYGRSSTELVQCGNVTVFGEVSVRHIGAQLPGSEHYALLSRLFSIASASDRYVIDVGGNEGGVGLFCALHGFRTLFVEPLPYNVQRIRSAVACNNLSEFAVVIPSAASNSTATVRISENNAQSSQQNGQILVDGQVVSSAVHTVHTIALGSALHALDSNILLAKFDVEGFEALAAFGMAKLFTERRVRFIHSEFSPSNIKSVTGVDPTDYLSFFLVNNFRLFVEDCYHNIDAKTKQELVPSCPVDPAIVSTSLAASAFENIKNMELTLENLHMFVRILNTSMVNVIGMLV